MRAFGWWIVTGFAVAFAFFGMMTIGIFFVPVVFVAAILAIRSSAEPAPAFGLIVGVGLNVLVIAMINRGPEDEDGRIWAAWSCALVVAGLVGWLAARRLTAKRPRSRELRNAG
jgi:hypothetical protein